MKRDDSAELERLRAEVGSLRERVATLEALLKCDALTGLGNRRAFDECLASELERTARSGKPSCLLLLDIDGLKTLNDNFSHAAGDAAIQFLAQSVVRTMRKLDSAHRLGGDEFAVILAGSGEEGGARVAERIHAALSAGLVFDSQQLQVKVSIGCATTLAWPYAMPLNERRDELIRRADAALYAEKPKRG